MDDYEALIAREVQKLEALRDTRKEVDEKISESEQFIKLLKARSSKGGDDLGALVERKMASKSAKPAQPALTTVVTATGTATGLGATVAVGNALYVFPKIRSDSAWPYIAVIMSAKPGAWKAADIVKAVLDAKVLKTDSAVRSALSTMAMKGWGLLDNDTAGYFALTDKARAFVASLKPNQYVMGGGTA